MNTRMMWTAAALALAALTALGCQDQRITGENARLWTQNKELQTELDRERAARDLAENERTRLASERDKLAAEAARLRQEVAGKPQPVAAANEPSAFADIPGVETEQRGLDTVVRIPGDILFDAGKVALKASALATLDRIAAVINSDYVGRGIRIEGYTDTDPIQRSGWADNLELSLERAAAVHRHLQSKGVDPVRMYAAGFGEHQPRGTKAQSRRVEIVVVDAGQ